jgi:hypothetical protein
VQARVGARGELKASTETRDADAAGRIEVAQGRLSDLDRRLRQIDDAITEATRRGRTRDALRSIDQQRQARAGIASERERAAKDLAALRTEKVSVNAHGRAAESEAAPIQYVAQLLGWNADPEEVVRWLIALMVLCCDPLALVLMAAAGARGRRA